MDVDYSPDDDMELENAAPAPKKAAAKVELRLGFAEPNIQLSGFGTRCWHCVPCEHCAGCQAGRW